MGTESTRDENASLKAQAESLIFVSHSHVCNVYTLTHTLTPAHIQQEHGENEKRVQELLERNAQLEMERVKRLVPLVGVGDPPSHSLTSPLQ